MLWPPGPLEPAITMSGSTGLYSMPVSLLPIAIGPSPSIGTACGSGSVA